MRDISPSARSGTLLPERAKHSPRTMTMPMSSAPAHIRPAIPDDIPKMVELLQVLFAIEADFSFDAEKHAAGLSLLLDSPTSLILVAERDDEVVGMATGQSVISTAEGTRALLVEDVVVQERHRGLGIGSRLLRTLASWAASKKISRMQLLADSNNQPALDFYARCGWRRTDLICLRSDTGLFSPFP